MPTCGRPRSSDQEPCRNPPGCGLEHAQTVPALGALAVPPSVPAPPGDGWAPVPGLGVDPLVRDVWLDVPDAGVEADGDADGDGEGFVAAGAPAADSFFLPASFAEIPSRTFHVPGSDEAVQAAVYASRVERRAARTLAGGGDDFVPSACEVQAARSSGAFLEAAFSGRPYLVSPSGVWYDAGTDARLVAFLEEADAAARRVSRSPSLEVVLVDVQGKTRQQMEGRLTSVRVADAGGVPVLRPALAGPDGSVLLLGTDRVLFVTASARGDRERFYSARGAGLVPPPPSRRRLGQRVGGRLPRLRR